MWIDEVVPERLAELFHHYHQALMPEILGKGAKAVPGKKFRKKRRADGGGRAAGAART